MSVRKLSLIASSAAMLAVPAYLAGTSPGYAQQVEEIVVSVRRRDESLQDVPLSVSTISDEQIKQFGINDTQDVVKYTAGLEFDEGLGAQDTRIVIRGLSPTRGRSNVAILVDGVDFTGEAVGTAGGGLLVNQQLLDVQRVEVVKGPQSALYGRSAFAGAIQYVTKQPSLEEAEGSANVQYGHGNSADSFRLDAAYGGPVTDNFGLRVNGQVYDSDGFYKNSLTDTEVGGSDGYGIALSGLWDAGGMFSTNARIAYSHDEYDPQAQARVLANTVVDIDESVAVQNGETPTLTYTSGLGGLIAYSYPECVLGGTPADGAVTSCLGSPKTVMKGKMPDGDDVTIQQSDDPRTSSGYPGTEVDIFTATLNLSWDFGGGVLTSLTGLTDLQSDQFFDGQYDALPAGDYTSLDQSYAFTLAGCNWADCSPTKQELVFDNETNLFSQEIRWASNFDGPVNFTAGGLFWKEQVKQVGDSRSIAPAIFRQNITLPPSPPLPGEAPPVESVVAANDVMTSVLSPSDSVTRRNTESISLYGLVEWQIADAWKLSLEGRWVDEELTVTGDQCNVPATEALTGLESTDINGTLYCNTQSFRGASSVGIANGDGALAAGTYTKAVYTPGTAEFSDSFFAPKAVVEWTPNDTQLLYFSVGQGIKPGGISTITAGTFFDADSNTFDKEELWAYELGSKSTLFDGSVILNGAVFFQDYTDKQVGVTRFDPVIEADVGSIENAGESQIYGLELEGVWIISDGWSLNAAYAYTKSEYTDFVIETSSSSNIARSLAGGGGGCLSIIPSEGAGNPPDDTTESCVVDLSDNDVEDVPRHSFVGNLTYEASLSSDMDWFGSGSFIYRDKRFVDEWNIKELQAYWLMDLRAGLRADKWELTLFVDNVLDDDTVKSAVDFGSIVDSTRQGFFPPSPPDSVVISKPDPRTVGLRANFSF